MNQPHTYFAIDLKSFYASVECVERGLDSMTTNLVVADSARTEKTICLAVSPSLKSYGIPGRARLFEVVQKVKEVNWSRQKKAPGQILSGESHNNTELLSNPSLALSYIVALPRMALYIDYSTRIYNVYLKYIAPEDIHVYSIDEVFIDVTGYLERYNMSARELAMTLVRDVLKTTGITATVGIGTNLYLSKVAMDIVAKHIPADQNGVRIAELDEISYRKQLWAHRPLTDFWRIGRGYASKLEALGMYTMGDVARCSVKGEDLLYKLFGINAELLIDHAWGWEPCTIADIKAYKPDNNSISSGQVLPEPYNFKKARLIAREMADQLALDLVDKGLVTDQIALNISFDRVNLTIPEICAAYSGPVSMDYYGRKIPKDVHGSVKLKSKTSSARLIIKAATEIFDRIVDENLLVRRLNLGANYVVRYSPETKAAPEQLDLFTDYETQDRLRREEKARLEKETRGQKALLAIRKKFGKNALIKGMNLEEGAKTMERNRQIGGHRA